MGGMKALGPASPDVPCTLWPASPKEDPIHESPLSRGVGHLDEGRGRQNLGTKQSGQPNPAVPTN